MASAHSTVKIKSHQPLHSFPMGLRWAHKTHHPKLHSTTELVDPQPPTDDVVAGRGSSQTAPSQEKGNDGDSIDGLLGNKASTRLRGGAAAGGGGGSERQRKVAEDKRKVWISLSKEEIEEDIYSMTGARPRRPKKRPRNVQKLLDNVFPALYLVGMSAESYRVQESLVDWWDSAADVGFLKF